MSKNATLRISLCSRGAPRLRGTPLGGPKKAPLARQVARKPPWGAPSGRPKRGQKRANFFFPRWYDFLGFSFHFLPTFFWPVFAGTIFQPAKIVCVPPAPGCGIRIFGDVWHPLPPRGGGLKNKFPNAPKLDTTHPYLLTA